MILGSRPLAPVHAYDTPEEREAAHQRAMEAERQKADEDEQRRRAERARQTEREREELNRRSGRPAEREPSESESAPRERTDETARPAAREPEGPPVDPNAPAAPPPPADDGDYAGRSDRARAEAAPQDDYAEVEAQDYKKRKEREFSVRVDPLNWLIQGRLNLELEASLWSFLSVQIVPQFVTATSPIALNYASLDDPARQHSNGIGPLAGVSIGLGAWLSGEPFKGYVIRLELTNYGYQYRSADAMGVIDRVTFTERRLKAFFGSHSRFGAFTFAGGFGLGLELHQVERCTLAYVSTDGNTMEAIAGADSGCHGKQQLALDRKQLSNTMNINGGLHPVYLEARFSVGVVF